jgi:hypothetical protein
MPPYPGAIMEQPDGVVMRLEIIMRIRNEDEQRELSNGGPPSKE